MILWSERICIVASLCNIKFAYAQNIAHHAWETPSSSSSDCMKQSYTNFKLRNHIETHYIVGQVSCSHSICTAEFPCSANIPYVIFSYSSKSPCIAYKNAGEREKTLKHQIIVSIDDAAFVEHGTVEQAEDCKVL